MKVIVPNHPVTKTEYTNDAGEKKISRKQTVALQSTDQPFPLPFSISIREGEPPYEPGEYELSASSFVTEKGRLALNYRVVLNPSEKK